MAVLEKCLHTTGACCADHFPPCTNCGFFSHIAQEAANDNASTEHRLAYIGLGPFGDRFGRASPDPVDAEAMVAVEGYRDGLEG